MRTDLDDDPMTDEEKATIAALIASGKPPHQWPEPWGLAAREKP